MTTPPDNSGQVARKGLVIVVSGPSGSGKSTIVHEVLDSKEFSIDFSVSATSRPPRAGEVDGKDYYFLDRTKFEAMRDSGELLEWAEVHGNYYGTPRDSVEEAVARGQWVLLEIDVQGHRQVKELLPEAISFFVRTATLEDCEARLRARGTETEEVIARRLEGARVELGSAKEYDFQIVNEDVSQATRTFRTLLAGIQALRGCQNV